nr:iron ABC transporter permease [Acidimicrobiia bacterium]
MTPPNRLPRWLPIALAVAPAGFLALFYAWPVLTLLARGLGVSAIADTLGEAGTWRVLWFTTWQAALSTLLTVAVGLAPAFVIARYRFPGRRLLGGLLTAAFVLPTVVMAAAVHALLPGRWSNGAVAILLAHVLFNLTVVVRTVGATWSRLPTDMEAAAATLGASPGTVARSVTLPLLAPAVLAAAAIVFAFTFTSFGVVRVLGGGRRTTVEVEIWRRATQLGDTATAATLTVLQLAVVVTVVAWTARH